MLVLWDVLVLKVRFEVDLLPPQHYYVTFRGKGTLNVSFTGFRLRYNGLNVCGCSYLTDKSASASK